MIGEQLAGEEIVVIFEPLPEGRMTQAFACCLVTPLGRKRADTLAEDFAQPIHGLDVLRGEDGLDRHESHGTSGTHVVDDHAMRQLLLKFLARLKGLSQ